MFGYHPQFEALAAFVAENGPLTQVAAQFIIPPLPIANFRNHGELGGGCLLDMGPYAAATMRILGGGAASDITALAGGRHPETGVDMGFSVLARLGTGAAFPAISVSRANIKIACSLWARSGSVIIERVFSPPADHRMEWRRRVRNVDDVVTFEPADTFARFLEAVTSAIAGGEHESIASRSAGRRPVPGQDRRALEPNHATPCREQCQSTSGTICGNTTNCATRFSPRSTGCSAPGG